MLDSPQASDLDVIVDDDIIDLVEIFLGNCRKNTMKMRDASSIGDTKTIAYFSHQIKGTGSMYGFQWLSKAGAAIEAQAKQEGSVLDMLAQLDFYLDNVRFRTE